MTLITLSISFSVISLCPWCLLVCFVVESLTEAPNLFRTTSDLIPATSDLIPATSDLIPMTPDRFLTSSIISGHP
ncbi:MAG: hypothetical protein OXH57_12450 [Ekhidna sp.]|nr:hypothetical protein [Ekhidna sp.]